MEKFIKKLVPILLVILIIASLVWYCFVFDRNFTRDILLAQSGRASLEDGGYAREAESYARSVPLSGGLALAESITRARMMLASNVSFAAAFEAVLLKISEEYAKWPW